MDALQIETRRPDLPQRGRPTDGFDTVDDRSQDRTDGQSGQVAFEYALVTAAVGLPLVAVVFQLLDIFAEVYKMQMLFWNLPIP